MHEYIDTFGHKPRESGKPRKSDQRRRPSEQVVAAPEAQLVGIGLAFQLLPPRRVLRSFRRRAEIFILKIHSYMNAVQPHGGMDHPALQTKTPKVKYVEKYTFAAREHTTRRLYYS